MQAMIDAYVYRGDLARYVRGALPRDETSDWDIDADTYWPIVKRRQR